MSKEDVFIPPEITDKDIHWVTEILGFLPKHAFRGEDRDDQRQNVLKSMAKMDVAACPGSGKTTLLVAKLSILARKWKYRTQGICVLSHTNAARREIEKRLGNTTVGRRLLSYPHYIGTIHGFVNEYLAVPWLRTKGYPIKMVDDDEVEKRRRAKMKRCSQYRALKNFVDKNELHQNIVSNWTVASPDFLVFKKNGEPAFKTPGRASNQLKKLVESVICDGYHRHDEMFMWAKDLMDKVADLTKILRDRFPILFIDEAQDNSEAQSEILYQIFMDGDSSVIRQRFGDENQAIYDSMGAKEAITDIFPDMTIKKSIFNSHRFGQRIANLADPLGVVPYRLKGLGPKKPLESKEEEGKHTIFFFDNYDINKVLDAYAELLLDTFSKQELEEGIFTAVGQIHRPPKKEEEKKIPQYVGHYWLDYDSELTRQTPKPHTFIQYILSGQKKVEVSREVYPAIELIAAGILRLTGIAECKEVFRPSKYKHRRVMQLLEKNKEVQYRYEQLINTFAINRKIPTKDIWIAKWRGVVHEIAETIAGVPISNSEANIFMEWENENKDHVSSPVSQRSRDNIYRFRSDGKEVDIRVGSIHSIKGETHTATLVLETFWYEHNLESLLPWLDGNKSGFNENKQRQKKRLKAHYVAMTRPTHLLCIALRQTALKADKKASNQEIVQRLKQHSWQIKFI